MTFETAESLSIDSAWRQAGERRTGKLSEGITGGFEHRSCGEAGPRGRSGKEGPGGRFRRRGLETDLLGGRSWVQNSQVDLQRKIPEQISEAELAGRSPETGLRGRAVSGFWRQSSETDLGSRSRMQISEANPGSRFRRQNSRCSSLRQIWEADLGGRAEKQSSVADSGSRAGGWSSEVALGGRTRR